MNEANWQPPIMSLITQPNLLQLSAHCHSSSAPADYLLLCSPSQISSLKARCLPLLPIAVKVSSRIKCLTKSTEENRFIEPDTVTSDEEDIDGEREDIDEQLPVQNSTSPQRIVTSSASDSLSLGIRDPVYEVCFLDTSVRYSWNCCWFYLALSCMHMPSLIVSY